MVQCAHHQDLLSEIADGPVLHVACAPTRGKSDSPQRLPSEWPLAGSGGRG